MNRLNSEQIVCLCQWLFRLNAAIWLIFGIWRLLPQGHSSESAVTMLVIAVLMLGNAAAMLWSSWAVQKQASRFRYGVLAILGINILLTISDQFGLFDLLTLLLDLVILALVLLLHQRRSRSWL